MVACRGVWQADEVDLREVRTKQLHSGAPRPWQGNQVHGGAYAGEVTSGRLHFLWRAKRFGVIRTKTLGAGPRTALE